MSVALGLVPAKRGVVGRTNGIILRFRFRIPHKKHIGWGRAIIANLVTIIVCNVVITTASLCIAYGYPVEAILPVRLVTNAVHFVVYSAATFLFATVIDNAYKRLNVRYAK